MTNLYLVRHGPTHERTMVGWRDVPADLSDREQIARVAEALLPDAVIVSSDLARCVQTADALASGRDQLPPEKDLREFDFGAWDGMMFDAIAARDPDLSRRFWEEPGDLRAPQGESWNDVATRVGRCLDALLAAHPDRDLIVVSHFGAILTQLRRALDCTPYQALAHRIDPLGLSEVRIEGGNWRAMRINHHP